MNMAWYQTGVVWYKVPYKAKQIKSVGAKLQVAVHWE